MERLTTDKPVKEMTMTELAHNSCYRGEDGNARYRDYKEDVDARQLAIELLKKFVGDPCDFTSTEDFDDAMMEAVQEGFGTMRGVIAVLYEQIWAKAELREYLRFYEDVGLTPERAAKLKESAALLDFFEADVIDGLDKLKEYERAKAEGRLRILPCHSSGADMEGVCPVCGGTVTYTGGMDRDDSGCTYPWSCDHCGATGGEGFNFVFDRHYNVRDTNGKPIPRRPE